MTSSEQAALKGLIENQNFGISTADKGDITVIMNTSQYLDLAYKHLGDKSTYQLLAVGFRSYLRNSTDLVGTHTGHIHLSPRAW